MKNIKYSGALLALFFITIILTQSSFAQVDSVKKSESKDVKIKNIIDARQFTFVAQSASPLGGGFRNLTSYFDAEISKDTMQSYLPYFGRAYTVSYGSTDGPLSFTSTNISYSVTPRKKGGWNILIKPKDKPEIQQYLFTIFDNGATNLNVTSTSRDPISFTGYITKTEKRKK